MELMMGRREHEGACLKLARELPEYFTERALDALEKDLIHNMFYVAEEEGLVMAFCTLNLKGEGLAELTWLAVRRGLHRSGVGSMLFEYVEKQLGEHGVDLLEVKTLSADEPYEPYEAARAFYQRMGFRLLETVENYPGWDDGNPCAIYVKPL